MEDVTVPASTSPDVEEPVKLETTGIADDQDFDMFLEEEEEKEPERPLSPGAIQAAFDSTPPVWTGKVSLHHFHFVFLVADPDFS